MKKEKFFAQVPFIKKKYEPERKCLFGFKAGEKNSNVRFSESNISTVSNYDPIVTHYKHSGPTSSMRKGILTAGNAPVSSELLQRKTVGKQYYFIEITAVSPCEPKRLL